MWINRDLAAFLDTKAGGLPVQIMIGPRQTGKTSLFRHISDKDFNFVSFDDLQNRDLAQKDPAFFLSQHEGNLILDEVQYVPNLFNEIKKRIDEERFLSRPPVFYRMTGSNQILMDKNIKETLVGRASYFNLNTLSVNEITEQDKKHSIISILFKGGWPQLYNEPGTDVVDYLNDYINSFVEKDIARTAGIEKVDAFLSVTKFLANRAGELLNYDSVSKDSGVVSNTVKEWVAVLERIGIVYRLRPYSSNLNKRLTKQPKIYFWDTGLAVRLQGFRDEATLRSNPKLGNLFENLVCAEILKWKNNFRKNIEIYLWHTKDGEEVDFIIKGTDKTVFIESKMAMQGVEPVMIPDDLKKDFPHVDKVVIVTYGGDIKTISHSCVQVPLYKLANYLNSAS